MIMVRINGAERDMTDSVDAQWINQQINGRRHEGEVVYVRVSIDEPGVNLVLTTPTCPNGAGGGGRLPNQEENALITLWNARGLGKPNFTGGDLVAFLKQMRQMVA